MTHYQSITKLLATYHSLQFITMLRIHYSIKPEDWRESRITTYMLLDQLAAHSITNQYMRSLLTISPITMNQHTKP